MGVKGPYLSHSTFKEITKKVNLKDYSGKTGAIDTSKFLHAACIMDPRSIARQQHEELVDGRDAELIPVDNTIRQMKRLGTSYDIGAFAVIDGRALPAKEEENAQRQKERKEAYKAAKAAEAKGKFNLASKLYFKACGTSPRMRQLLADSCAAHGISYVKAPHEADAQMVRAVKDGLADFIISEDADMLALGSTCTIFKINFKDGTGQEVTQERLFNDEGSGFKDFTLPMLVQQNILQGNDYSKGVDGFGIKTALEFVKDHKTLDSVLAALKQKFEVEEGEQLLLPNGFSEDMLQQAYWTMRGHPVFKMTEDGYELSNLHPLPSDIVDQFPSLQSDMSRQVVAGLASGFLDEETEQPFVDNMNFDDDADEVDDAPPSVKQERIQREAAVYEQEKKWLDDEVNKLRADPEKYAETVALFDRLKEENEARVTTLDKDDSYRVVYEQYQYAAECRMSELKKQLPDSISEDQIDEMIALAKDQCMVIALKFIIREDGTVRDNAAIVNACKFMPDPNSGLPKRDEMTASLCDRGHAPYLVKDTGGGEGAHFSPKEVHVVGTSEPTEDTILQVHRIECHQSDGDVMAFFLEQVQGEFFRDCFGGTGYAMNRCVSGLVRDPGGLAKHASGVLVILDPLSKLRDGSVGISNQQSTNNMIDIKRNLPKSTKLLRCTTSRATTRGRQGRKNTPLPYIISTALPPTDDSVIHITMTTNEMESIVKGDHNHLTAANLGDGKLVLSQSQGLPSDIYVIPFRPTHNLKCSPGQTPKPDIKRLLEQRDTSLECPILLSTSENLNEGIITITKGSVLAQNLVRGFAVLQISQDKLQAGPMLVLDWKDTGIEIWAHRFDPEISPGKPGEIFNKLIYDALASREVINGGVSNGAISVFRSEHDANNHLPILTGPGWGSRNSARDAIGARVKTAEALAGKAFDSIIGSVYTRKHEKEDGYVDENKLTLFYQRAIEHYPKLVDRLKKYPDTLCVGKSESQSEPELLHEPEHSPAASITPPPLGRGTRSRKRSSESNGENDQPNSPQKSRSSRRRT